MIWRAVVGLGVSALFLAGCSTAEQPGEPDTTPIDQVTPQPVLGLGVGDCLMDISTPLGQHLTDIPVINCDEPHDSEVFAELILEGSGFPGVDEVMAQGAAGCMAEFGAFIGLDYPSSTLDFTYYYPTASSWAIGDRSVFCVVFDPGILTTGTLAGSQR